MLARDLLFTCLLVAAAGCAQSDPNLGRPMPAPGESTFQYVVDHIDMPSTVGEANDMGFNLDGDEGETPDNHLGMILSQLFQSDFGDLDGNVSRLINSGSALHLVEVNAKSFDASSATLALFIGSDMDSNRTDNFTGAESFEIDFGVSAHSSLPGHINQGTLEVGPGNPTIRLGLPGSDDTFTVELVGARLQASITDGNLSGHLGGAITKQSLDTTIMPAIHKSILWSVEVDCGTGSCVSGSNGEFFTELLDLDHNGEISLVELIENPLVKSLAAPDVDLLDSSGNFNPREDGTKDSLSLGLGFTAVGASF